MYHGFVKHTFIGIAQLGRALKPRLCHYDFEAIEDFQKIR
jgi:hypothetical protein